MNTMRYYALRVVIFVVAIASLYNSFAMTNTGFAASALPGVVGKRVSRPSILRKCRLPDNRSVPGDTVRSHSPLSDGSPTSVCDIDMIPAPKLVHKRILKDAHAREEEGPISHFVDDFVLQPAPRRARREAAKVSDRTAIIAVCDLFEQANKMNEARNQVALCGLAEKREALRTLLAKRHDPRSVSSPTFESAGPTKPTRRYSEAIDGDRPFSQESQDNAVVAAASFLLRMREGGVEADAEAKRNAWLTRESIAFDDAAVRWNTTVINVLFCGAKEKVIPFYQFLQHFTSLLFLYLSDEVKEDLDEDMRSGYLIRDMLKLYDNLPQYIAAFLKDRKFSHATFEERRAMEAPLASLIEKFFHAEKLISIPVLRLVSPAVQRCIVETFALWVWTEGGRIRVGRELDYEFEGFFDTDVDSSDAADTPAPVRSDDIETSAGDENAIDLHCYDVL